MVLHHSSPSPSGERCFFCGQIGPVTREHVFPAWLQRQLGLWNHFVVLLNGSAIPYRQLTVPACAPCNNVALSQLEDEICRAQLAGADKVRALGHEKLFIWLSKILFGILYAEALLPIDRREPDAGTIVSEQMLDAFGALHFLMQALRIDYRFESLDVKYHTSIMVFPIQLHPDLEHRFQFRDCIETGCLAIRFGEVGLIYIPDGGAQERIADEHFKKLYEMALHPVQFDELTALTFTKARTFNRNPVHIIGSSPGGVRVVQLPLAGLSEKPLWDDFHREHYARVLSQFWNMPMERIMPASGKLWTTIGDYSNPIKIDVNAHPFG